MVFELIVGMGGGIASGKSTVGLAFEKLGAAVIDADIVARQVVEPGRAELDQIAQAFGREYIDETGNLDRAKMRTLVFSQPSKRAQLEAILHPAIRKELFTQSAAAAKHAPYVIMMVPLLAEMGLVEHVDRVLMVDVTRDMQLERLMQRDTMTIEGANAMINAQSTRQQRLEIADDVIENHGSVENIHQQVSVLHADYLSMAATS